MTQRQRWFFARILAVAIPVLLAGCGEDTGLIGPDNQLEVNNETDTFQWQVSALSKVSQTLTYSWENTGTRATVNQASAISRGSATLRITDSQGTEIYFRGLEENGTFDTDQGAAGAWTVTIQLTNVSGTLNFRLQKP